MSEKEVGTGQNWKSDSTTVASTASSSVLLNTYQRLTTMNGLRRWNLANIDASYFISSPPNSSTIVVSDEISKSEGKRGCNYN